MRINVGVMQPGARPIGIGVSGAVRGVAMINGALVGVVAKPATPHELAAECFCSLFAKDLGLNAPDCAIVSDGSQYLFASVDMHHPNLGQAFNFDPKKPDQVLLKVVVETLSEWAGIGRLLAFDILVENADRNIGNLLTDGSDYWVIDHARAMGAFNYQKMQPLFTLMKMLQVPKLSGVQASAVAAALTFQSNCHSLSVSDMQQSPHVSPFAANFDVQISARLSGLISNVATTL